MRGLAWVVLAIGLAACGVGAGGGRGNESALCTTVCRCQAQLPGQQRACIDECVSELVTVMVPEPCVECVFTNGASCPDLLTECLADGGACNPNTPEPF